MPNIKNSFGPSTDILSDADYDGSRYVWFHFRKHGHPYTYEPTASLNRSGRFAEATKNAPQLGDVAWWNGFMGIYDPHIPYTDGGSSMRLNLRTAIGERSYKQLEKEHGPVKWLRHKNASLNGSIKQEEKTSWLGKLLNSITG